MRNGNDEDIPKFISPYIKKVLVYALKKEYEYQERGRNLVYHDESELKELQEFYRNLTGEVLDIKTLWI